LVGAVERKCCRHDVRVRLRDGKKKGRRGGDCTEGNNKGQQRKT